MWFNSHGTTTYCIIVYTTKRLRFTHSHYIVKLSLPWNLKIYIFWNPTFETIGNGRYKQKIYRFNLSKSSFYSNQADLCLYIAYTLRHLHVCWTGPFDLMWSRGYIYLVHYHLIIIIITSEVSTVPIVVIFCVVVRLRWLYQHMLWASYISWNTCFFLFYYCAVLWYSQTIRYIMIWWSCSIVCRLH